MTVHKASEKTLADHVHRAESWNVGAVACVLFLVLTFCTFPAQTPLYVQVGGSQLFFSDILAVGLAMYLGFLRRPKVLPQTARFCVPLLVAVYFAGAIHGLVSGAGFSPVYKDARGIAYALAFMFIFALSAHDPHWRRRVRITVRGVLLVSAIFLLLAQTGALTIYGRDEDQAFAASTGVQYIGITRLLSSTGYLASAILGLCLIRLLTPRSENNATRDPLPCDGFSLLASVYVCYVSVSRSTLIAAAVAVAVFAILSLLRLKVTSRTIALVLAAVIGYVVLAYSGFWHSQQWQGYATRVLGGVSESATTDDSSLVLRSIESSYAIRSIGLHPFGGTGLGVPYRPPIFYGSSDFWLSSGLAYLHNGVLWPFVKFGLLGGSLVCAFLIFIAVSLARTRQVAYFCAYVGLLSVLYFLPLTYAPETAGLLGAFAGISLGRGRVNGGLGDRKDGRKLSNSDIVREVIGEPANRRIAEIPPLNAKQDADRVLVESVFGHTSRSAVGDRVWRDILGYERPGADNRAVADAYAGQDGDTVPDPHVRPNRH